jgi:hypothetical protein
MEKIKCGENVSGTVRTRLYFLCNLQIGPIAGLLHYTRLERLARDKYSSILGLLASNEEN